MNVVKQRRLLLKIFAILYYYHHYSYDILLHAYRNISSILKLIDIIIVFKIILSKIVSLHHKLYFETKYKCVLFNFKYLFKFQKSVPKREIFNQICKTSLDQKIIPSFEPSIHVIVDIAPY